MKILRIPLVCAVAIGTLATQAYAQIQTAGALLVNVDPSSLSAGPTSWVTNSGSVGGVFEATGLSGNDLPVIVNVGGGSKGIMFDGRNFMQQVAAPEGAKLTLPAELTGANKPYSIECWVVNPSTWSNDGETMVYWGVRGAGGNMTSFTYSGNGDHGAADHWGSNLGWPAVPSMATWHHLVTTFDGTNQTLWVDGVLQTTAKATLTYNPVSGQPITLACQRNADGTLVGWGGVRGTLTLGKVRIHSAALAPAQVVNNYNFEKASFVMGPSYLAARPVHRYAFNNAATNDAVGLVVPDVGTPGGADALVQGVYGSASAAFTGKKIHLTGGTSDVGPYIDLPNGLLSSLSSSNGGPGQVSFEGWVVVNTTTYWPRYFMFGSSTAGEVTGPGGSFTGVNHIMLNQVNNYADWHDLEISNNGFNSGPNTTTHQEFGFMDAGAWNVAHYAVTWNEATGEVVVYENGVEATRLVTDKKFVHIDDVNNWLGRSNWSADNNLQGDYDDFRIYNYVLSPAQVQNDYQAGADTVLVPPGPLQALHLQVPRANTMAGTFEQLSVLGDYQNVSNLIVTAQSGLTFASSDTGVLTVSSNGLLTAVAAGTANVTATLQGISDSKSITVTAVTAPLAHRYGFTNDASDSIGGTAWDGTPSGGAFVFGGQLSLDGQSGYLQLPPGMITNLDAVTVEAWASFNTPLATWGELFAFGDQNASGTGRYYIMMTPHSGGADARISISDADPGYNHEQIAAKAGVLDGQTNVHIAAVYHPYAGYEALYLNGVLAAINTNVTIPLSSIVDNISVLGHSIYSGDPFVNCSVDEFRVYNGPRTAQQIAVDRGAGPDQLVSSPGNLLAIHLGVTNEIFVGIDQQATVNGDFVNVSNVNMFAFGPVTLTSSDASVLTVNSNGLIHALKPGTSTVTATYSTFTDSKAVTVVILPATLAHRYTFNSDMNDSVGTANGTPNGNAVLLGGKLVLDGTTGTYLDLGPGVIDSFFAMSVEAWVSFSNLGAWARLYDFGDQNGNNGNTSIFFCPHTGNGTVEQTIFNTAINDHIALNQVLDGVTNLHIVAVYNPFSGYQKLYFNGRLVGQNTSASVLLSTINDANSWIGRSLFNADPYLNASIDEFRIYSGALAPDQIAVNDAAGPNQIVTSLGALQTVRFLLGTNMLVEQTQQAQLLGDYANVTGVNLFFYDAPQLSSSDTNVVTVSADGLVHAVGVGQATITATFNNTSYTKVVTVGITPVALAHRYSFNDAVGAATIADSIGGADGTLVGGAATDGAGQMWLEGTTSYAELPAGLISSLSNATFEVWVTPTNSRNWARVFDFGIDDGAGAGQSYAFLAAAGGPGMRFAVKPAGGSESPVLNSPAPLPTGQESFVAVTFNASAGVATLYQDGVAVASATIANQLSVIQDTHDWLGRSQYAADALFAGSYNEFRIYNGSLLPAEIAAHKAAGPNTIPAGSPALKASVAAGNVQISWPGWAARYHLQSSPVVGTGASWQDVGKGAAVNGDSLTVTLPATGQAMFFRLSN